MEQKDSTGAVFLPVANTVVVGLTPIWRNVSFCQSGRHHEALSSAHCISNSDRKRTEFQTRFPAYPAINRKKN